MQRPQKVILQEVFDQLQPTLVQACKDAMQIVSTNALLDWILQMQGAQEQY